MAVLRQHLVTRPAPIGACKPRERGQDCRAVQRLRSQQEQKQVSFLLSSSQHLRLDTTMRLPIALALATGLLALTLSSVCVNAAGLPALPRNVLPRDHDHGYGHGYNSDNLESRLTRPSAGGRSMLKNMVNALARTLFSTSLTTRGTNTTTGAVLPPPGGNTNLDPKVGGGSPSSGGGGRRKRTPTSEEEREIFDHGKDTVAVAQPRSAHTDDLPSGSATHMERDGSEDEVETRGAPTRPPPPNNPAQGNETLRNQGSPGWPGERRSVNALDGEGDGGGLQPRAKSWAPPEKNKGPENEKPPKKKQPPRRRDYEHGDMRRGLIGYRPPKVKKPTNGSSTNEGVHEPRDEVEARGTINTGNDKGPPKNAGGKVKRVNTQPRGSASGSGGPPKKAPPTNVHPPNKGGPHHTRDETKTRGNDPGLKLAKTTNHFTPTVGPSHPPRDQIDLESETRSDIVISGPPKVTPGPVDPGKRKRGGNYGAGTKANGEGEGGLRVVPRSPSTVVEVGEVETREPPNVFGKPAIGHRSKMVTMARLNVFDVAVKPVESKRGTSYHAKPESVALGERETGKTGNPGNGYGPPKHHGRGALVARGDDEEKKPRANKDCPPDNPRCIG
ncbi:hypothetical protein BDZ90DRAFT_75758 [Jaminaea rosea]|uniref:Uncharacterized protein n=1 Tax=Jaminaea rosea TaxID=1569628 RepID=A0A316UJJ7_9BASI|nr:hypothetical protein BDZ90DRAFT_75758 [Jaminaea rosea]PWN25452.1 hypothetical protein BDZ90DRAFT_75758 [Jaminaea rosea]